MALLTLFLEPMLPFFQCFVDYQLSLLFIDNVNNNPFSFASYHTQSERFYHAPFQRGLVVLIHVALLDLILHRFTGKVHPICEVFVTDVQCLVVVLDRVEILLLLRGVISGYPCFEELVVVSLVVLDPRIFFIIFDLVKFLIFCVPCRECSLFLSVEPQI